MHWKAVVAGAAIVWLVGEIADWHGAGFVVLGGIAGLLLARLAARLTRTELHLQARVDKLAAEIAAMKSLASGEGAQAVAIETEPAPITAMDVAATEVPAPGTTQPGGSVSPWLEPEPIKVRPREIDEHSVAVTSSLGASVLAWFKGGNTIVRVAVLILFIGVAFLLRYAAEHTTVPIEWRLAGVALAGFGLAALGLRLVAKRRGYGLSLQGAGVGIVYLALFAAYRLYALVPVGLTFSLLAALAAITALLAVRQNALPLAVLGFGGGFLAPVLASTGQGSHVALFSYYLVLNLAIAWIAQRQSWKLLNLIGFLFTFTIGGLWGARSYTSVHFASTEPFLVVHFLLYLYIAVQYTRGLLNEPGSAAKSLPAVDGGLLFGVPIVAFGLQAAMLRDQPLALASSAAVLSAVYLLVGRWLWRQAGQQMLLLVEGLLALGIVFLALISPLALDARWTGAAWAIQGAGVVWMGLRQRRWWAAGMGLVLQLGAAFAFWGEPVRLHDSLPFANGDFVGALVLALAALTSARLLQRHAQIDRSNPVARTAGALHWLMLGLGVVQAWVGGWIELDALQWARVDDAWLAAAWSAALLIAFELAHRPLRWPELRWPARGLMLLSLLASVAGALDHFGSASAVWTRYANGLGAVEACLLVALGLWRLSRDDDPKTAVHSVMHLALAWYAMLHAGVFLYVAGAHLVARHLGWTPAAAIALPTLLAITLIGRAAAQRWPVGALRDTYVRGLFRPWLGALMSWVLLVNTFSDGSMAPLPYLPLLNPLDLGHALVLIYALRLARLEPWSAAASTVVTALAAALSFWWLNSLLIRSLHHWAATPMWFDGALDFALVQTGLTLLWTLTALITMLYATRRAAPEVARTVWMAGAVLLGIVVLKLFVVDLSNVGTLARIVSFLVVGALMLVIGYVSPLPPSTSRKAPKEVVS